MDVKAAFHSAVAEVPRLTIVEFTTWPQLIQFEISGVIVKPDGFIHITEARADGSVKDHRFFLELDRSTETQERIAARAACYIEYYRSGEFARRCGASRSERNDFPFRLLMVLNSPERLDNSARRLLSVSNSRQVWLSTITETLENPFGPVWSCPTDCDRGRDRMLPPSQAIPAGRKLFIG